MYLGHMFSEALAVTQKKLFLQIHILEVDNNSNSFIEIWTHRWRLISELFLEIRKKVLVTWSQTHLFTYYKQLYKCEYPDGPV